ADVDDATLKELLMNLGGHDIAQILQAFATAAKIEDRPVAIMAYTIKGWGLPIAGHIDNHAAQLTQAHIMAMQERLGIAEGHEWDSYDAADPIAQWILQMQRQLMMSQPLPPAAPVTPWPLRVPGTLVFPPRLLLPPPLPPAAPVTPWPLRVPEILGIRVPERASTQGAFGHILVALSDIKEVAARLGTTSAAVGLSVTFAHCV